MRKICFLIQQYNNSGGTERVLSQIANGLNERGYSISIISTVNGTKPHFKTNADISLYEIFASDRNKPMRKHTNLVAKLCHNIVYTVQIKKKLDNMIKMIAPDIIVAVDILLYYHIVSWHKKIKTVAWEHYCLTERTSRMLKFSRNLAVKYANKIVVLSKGDFADYKNCYPKAINLIQLYNPVAFYPRKFADMSNKVVIAAGRYEEQKGFDLLIDAWSRIEKKVLDWELRIFGDGVEKEKLQSMIDENHLRNVKLLPYSNNLSEEMTEASVYVLSSRFEGWGLVLIEAQSQKLACVSFRCKHGPSEIIDDGVNGILVEPENVDKLASVLLEVLQNNNLREKFSANSQNKLHRYNIDCVLGQWIDMLESI